jgi:hypothetical protein
VLAQDVPGDADQVRVRVGVSTDSVLTFEHPHEGLLHELLDVVTNQAAEEPNDGRRVTLEELLVHAPTITKNDLKPGDVDSNGSVMQIHHLVPRSSLLLAAWLAAALLQPNSAAASCDDASGPLTDLPCADIRGEPLIFVYLDQGNLVVYIDGQFHKVDGAFDVPFDGLDRMTVVFVVPPGTVVSVFEDDVWTRNLDPASTTELPEFEVYRPSALRAEPEKIRFVFEEPGQRAPTAPTLVIRPIPDDPDPS